MAECTCGADKFEGAKHQEQCPAYTAPTEARHTLEDPGMSFTRVRFLQGWDGPQIDSYQPDGTPAEIVVGQLRCVFRGTRDVETMHGMGLVADVGIINDGELGGLEVSFFCTSMLARLIVQVESGAEIEILRLADKSTKGGKAHQYQVDILDGPAPEPPAESGEDQPVKEYMRTETAAMMDTGPSGREVEH